MPASSLSLSVAHRAVVIVQGGVGLDSPANQQSTDASWEAICSRANDIALMNDDEAGRQADRQVAHNDREGGLATVSSLGAGSGTN